jgi:hypothetical protein
VSGFCSPPLHAATAPMMVTGAAMRNWPRVFNVKA